MVHLTLAIGQFFAIILMQIARAAGTILGSAILTLCFLVAIVLAGVWIGRRLRR